jgi:alpha-galactosidase
VKRKNLMHSESEMFITNTRREFIETMVTVATLTGLVDTVAAKSSQTSDPVIARGDPLEPEFHGPRVVGGTPGKPFLFRVPFTGKGAVALSADSLPEGLRMTDDGIISGIVPPAGEYRVTLRVSNAYGKAARILRIVSGEHKLALTPQMGWNSWNAYDVKNDAARTKASAEAMLHSGLAAKGFNYINIDAGWQNGRTASGEIKVAPQFGNMKDLVDYIHSKGLRFGLYSSPGPETCGGFTGSYGHEAQDANTYARWGGDYLKYDWCSYGEKVPKHPDLEQYIKPYAIMGEALRKTSRDIFYSLCQYGMGHVWTWGGSAPVYGNSYRISYDIQDTWDLVCRNGFDQDGPLFPFAGPGHWNDPDMLVVGYGYFEQRHRHWTRLTPHEQQTHITLWCMLAAPLLLGCDLQKLNKFTTDLMTNTEVLAVNQDELGRQAQCVARKRSLEIWARPLWDGSCAVAYFNRGLTAANIEAHWAMLDPVLVNHYARLRGKQPVRDLWQRKDLGILDGYAAMVPSHGAVMLKVGYRV